MWQGGESVRREHYVILSPMVDRIDKLRSQLARFANERDWDQFHNPKNLAMALLAEAGELIEHFQWLSPQQAANLSAETKAEVALEIADMLLFLLRLLGSDFLFWAGLKVARDQVIRYVFATPPELVAAASAQERARVNAMADGILPFSMRVAGLRDDTGLGKRLGPYALDSIRAPTLVISARDDGFGTYAGAEYTASQIPAAKFVGFASGGHLWVGHDDEVRSEILALLRRSAQP